MTAILSLKLNDYELRPRGHDHLWRVMRDLGRDGGIFTIRDIERQTRNQHFNYVRAYVSLLAKANILDCVGQLTDGAWKGAKQYKLLAAPRATPSVRRDGTLSHPHRSQSQMWTAIRSLAQFTKHDLSLAASTEECPIPVSSAKRYIYALKAAGYFIILQEGRPLHAEVYRLRPDMQTGPLPPRILRTNAVYDQNRNKIVGSLEFDEVAA